MSLLIDKAVTKVQDIVHWNDVKHIEMLYRDGMAEGSQDKTFFDFVLAIYNEVGRNKFFEGFIDEQYKREQASWKHRLETAQVLEERSEVFDALRQIKFNDIDTNRDKNISFKEFQK